MVSRRFASLMVAIIMAVISSPVCAYTRPEKANIDSNSQHPSMKRVGFKEKEGMRSLTNRGFDLKPYSTGCKVGEDGYYTGCKYSEQGITIWPTIAFNNEDGYQYYYEYGWVTCDELITLIKLDYFREGWEKKYKNFTKPNWHYGGLDRKGFTVNVCYDICINTPDCAYFFFQTQNPGVDSDMHGVPLETSCELHRGCTETRTALYPGTTFEVLDVEFDCLATCYGFSCEHYVQNGNYTCAELEGISFHCDCSGCECTHDDDYVSQKKTPPVSKLLPSPVPQPKSNKSNASLVCRGFWANARDLHDPLCNTPPLSPWGGNLEHQICPGFVPGYLFRNASCTGTATDCTAAAVCDSTAGYTGTPNITCDVAGAKFNVTGCSRGDLVTENGKIFRYFTHLDCSQGNIHVVGLSTTGNPAGKSFSLITPEECAEECNKWTKKHTDNPCKAFSMGNGACKTNDCERVTPDMCYNHCSNSRRCVLKSLVHCTEHLQRDLTYDLWWNIEDTSLKGYAECSYRFVGNNTKGRAPDGGEDNKEDYNATKHKVIFGSTDAREGKMDCVRDYGVEQNPESARLHHLNFGVWDRDGI